MSNKRFWWLKLDRNFFKRHDVMVVESQENGPKYVLFYMKLLLESIDHEGALRFSEVIPYNEKMLATITNTDIDIVRSAIKIFHSLDMLEIWDDKTIFMNETNKMIGSETASTKRSRKHREQKKIEQNDTKALQCNTDATKCNGEIELELDLELEQELYLESRVEDLDIENNETTIKNYNSTLEENNFSNSGEEITLNHVEFIFKKLKLTSNPINFYEYYKGMKWKKLNGLTVNLENLVSNAKAWEVRELKFKATNPESNVEDVASGYDLTSLYKN